MEITINLPESVWANLASIAGKSRRRIDEVLVEKIENAFAVDAERLEKQISLCSDKEVLEIAQLEMPAGQDQRLSELLQNQNEGELSIHEQNEMWNLMELGRLTTLKKAFALREVSKRNGSQCIV